MTSFINLLERLLFKLTSGRFIFTVIVAFVFCHMSLNGILKEDRIMEVILVVLCAYFSRTRMDANGDVMVSAKLTTTTTTTTLLPK